MPELVVQEVLSATDKQLDGKGTFTSFKLTLQSGETAELFQRKDSIPPKAGDRIDGTLEQSAYGLKIKKNPNLMGGKGGGFRPRDPAETAAIQRQHSQSAAVEFLKAKIQAGALDGEFPPMDKFRVLVDWFQRDIEWGVRLASNPAYGRELKVKDTQRTGVTDAPADTEQFVHLPADGAGTPFATE